MQERSSARSPAVRRQERSSSSRSVNRKESLLNGSAKPGAATRSGCPLRTPDSSLEPEDASFHLRGEKRHPYHRSAEDSPSARAGSEARSRRDPSRRQRSVRLHQAAARQHREERSRALRGDVRDGEMAGRIAHQLPDREKAGETVEGTGSGERGWW